MEPIKRRRYYSTTDDNKRKKLQISTVDTAYLSEKESITRFEYLSNEVIYEIFEYLDIYHIYESFSNLNIRLENLFRYSTIPIKISLSSISKSSFEYYYKHIILPNTHRIRSFSISNLFLTDLVFSPPRTLTNFIKLQALILNKFKSKYLSNFLDHLVSLPSLSSLVIIPINHIHNKNKLFLQIFRLPVLKYCKVLLDDGNQANPLFIATKDLFSPIEHMVINNSCQMNELNALLSYTPQLRRLSLQHLYQSNSKQIEPCSVMLNHLTHASLNIEDITFDKFEPFINNLFHHLEVLHISTTYDIAYLDANRWEQLIVSYMPRLRIFDFQHNNSVDNDFKTQRKYSAMINQFNSPFWFERQWFFAYQFYWQEYSPCVIIYSTNPYRKKQYTLYKELNTNQCLHQSENNVDSVNSVHIQDEKAMIDSVNYFPNATKLTVSCTVYNVEDSLSTTLNHIVSLEKLRELNIDCFDLDLKQMIILLHSIPNIHTWIINILPFFRSDFVSMQLSDSFQLVSTTNKIKNLTIRQTRTAKEVEFFVALCPRLQCLSIDVEKEYLQSIVSSLLSKKNIDTRHLFFLCVKNSTPSRLQTVMRVINSKKHSDQYLIQSILLDLYLWW